MPDTWEPPPNDAAWRGDGVHPQPQPLAEQAEFDEAERLRLLDEIAGSATCDDSEDDEC